MRRSCGRWWCRRARTRMSLHRSSPPLKPACENRRPARISWARLLKRVFEIDLEHCPNCGGQLKIIAAILEAPVIERILTHLGLQARAPPRTPARERQVAQAAPDRGSTAPVQSAQHHRDDGAGCARGFLGPANTPWSCGFTSRQPRRWTVATAFAPLKRAAAYSERCPASPRCPTQPGHGPEKQRLKFLSSVVHTQRKHRAG